MIIALTEFQSMVRQNKQERYVRPDTTWVLRKLRGGLGLNFKLPHYYP